MSHQISFNADVSVSIISHHNRRWLTAEDVGRCLGYGKGKERQGITNAFNRHIDEFSEEDSVVIKLMTTDGKSYNTRIFSETGCIKLGFFSNTPTAKTFRKWAAKVLSGSLKSDGERLQQLQAAYLAAHPEAARLLRYRQMDLNHVEIGKLLGVSGQTVRDRLKKLAAFGIVDYAPAEKFARAGRRGHAAMRQKQAFLAAQQSLSLEG